MTAFPLDPAPRSYPTAVTLLRRARRGAAAAPEGTSLAETEAWLLGPAAGEDDLLALFESLVWRLAASGLPLDRASLSIGTLHPQIFGFAWNWERADGFCDEVKVDEASLRTDSYRRNPISQVIERGEAFRGRADDPVLAERHPLLKELAAQGFTEYLALPIRAGGAYHNTVTFATKQPAGFSDKDLAALERLLALFGLHVERHIALRIAGNVLDTYLGGLAGRRVLEGSIKRGTGEAVRAVIWVSDLRGFTGLTDRLSGREVTLVLNAYFDGLAGAVLSQGGEILKFIGDGLLAAFPFERGYPDDRGAAEAALTAAEEALQAIAAINDSPPEALRGIQGWAPLRSGIALHEGEVFFGNVGAPERLDFTVIGRAVNEASRVEALCKSLNREILITEPVARRLTRPPDSPLEDLGRHDLRGVAEAMGIFAPKAAD